MERQTAPQFRGPSRRRDPSLPLGYSLGNAIDERGVATATYFALIFAAGHLTQEVRDYDGDAMNGIRTNAVTFGQRRVFAASLVLFGLAHVVCFLLALEGILPRTLAALVVLTSFNCTGHGRLSVKVSPSRV